MCIDGTGNRAAIAIESIPDKRNREIRRRRIFDDKFSSHHLNGNAGIDGDAGERWSGDRNIESRTGTVTLSAVRCVAQVKRGSRNGNCFTQNLRLHLHGGSIRAFITDIGIFIGCGGPFFRLRAR